jgi:hypothetical protein
MIANINGSIFIGHSAISSELGRQAANTSARKSGKKDYSKVAKLAANGGKRG